jgi:hypothetical protein
MNWEPMVCPDTGRRAYVADAGGEKYFIPRSDVIAGRVNRHGLTHNTFLGS